MRTTLTTLLRLTAIGILATVIAVGSAGCSQEKSKTTCTKKNQAKRNAKRTQKVAKRNSAGPKSVTSDRGAKTKKNAVADKSTKPTMTKARGQTSKVANAKKKGNSQSDTRATKPVVQTPVKQVATKSPNSTSAQDVAEDMQPIGDDPSQLREHYSNVIYATIRIRMEEAIQRRAKLFKQGANPNSEEIVNLERQILKARSLLMENGETVQPVYPPIAQRTTPTK